MQKGEKLLSIEKFIIQCENLPNWLPNSRPMSKMVTWMKARYILCWEKNSCLLLHLEVSQTLHVQHTPQVCSSNVPFLSTSCHSAVHVRKLRVVFDSSLLFSLHLISCQVLLTIPHKCISLSTHLRFHCPHPSPSHHHQAASSQLSHFPLSFCHLSKTLYNSV